ncbi:MAG: hydrolase [Porticoccaceae bacterium]|nr:hydrolase [Porticoccaceae bacterium]
MDPLTQGVFGSLWAQAGSGGTRLRRAAGAGLVAGMAPDLDVLIRSPDDALLFIDYHRHFTHAIPFAPLGGLVVALALWPLLGRSLGFWRLYLYCFLGYLSHGLLDACTSYGTYLLWPFSETRFAWNWISIIDPIFTLPLVALAGLALVRRLPQWSWLALAWAGMYLGLGAVQHERAEEALAGWAASNGVAVDRHVVKPSFGNLILWRGVIEEGDHLRAVAIRQVPFTDTRVYPGGKVVRFHPSAVGGDAGLQSDLKRFAYFSDGWLFRHGPMESGDNRFVGDFRYSMDPAGTGPLWGIHFNPDVPGGRVRFERVRNIDPGVRRQFLSRLLGEAP